MFLKPDETYEDYVSRLRSRLAELENILDREPSAAVNAEIAALQTELRLLGER